MAHITRQLSMMAGLGAVACCLTAGSLEAAVIQGRVVDSAGQPVPGAEIRVWRKAPPVNGARPNEAVSFDGKQTLLADGDGRFETPDIVGAKTPVRVVAQAESMLGGHTGWLLPSGDVTEVEDIVLAHLGGIAGQVVDSHGVPIAGATVFNGDGDRRVETKSGSTGRFLLDGVPETALFLFAEKPGYRLAGIVLADEKPVELRMARRNEPIEPLKSRRPILTAGDRVALARRVLDLKSVMRGGGDRRASLQKLATVDPQAAWQWLDRTRLAEDASWRDDILREWMRRKSGNDWDSIHDILVSSEDDLWAAGSLIRGAAYSIPQTDPDRRRAWLNEGLARLDDAQDPVTRLVLLAAAAEGFWRIGDLQRATGLAREAAAAVDQLPQDLPVSEVACAPLARALAPVDLPAALNWLDRVKTDFQFAQEGASVALELAPIDTAKAEKAWNHVGKRAAKDRAFIEGRDLHAADFCFRLARCDLEAARRVADAVASPFWRVQARAAVASTLDGERAKELLSLALADPALLQDFSDGHLRRPPQNTALALGAVLPVAERVDPVEARELLWRVFSRRPLQPIVGGLDDEVLFADCALAQMVSRYEPAIARALMEPAVQRLPQFTFTLPTERFKGTWVIEAAGFIDPQWATELLDRLPEPPNVSLQQIKNNARLFLVGVLGLTGEDYWKFAGLWEPEE